MTDLFDLPDPLFRELIRYLFGRPYDATRLKESVRQYAVERYGHDPRSFEALLESRYRKQRISALTQDELINLVFVLMHQGEGGTV